VIPGVAFRALAQCYAEQNRSRIFAIVFGRVSMTMGSCSEVSDQADRLSPEPLLRANVASLILHMSRRFI
jgi:hypothetical protein